MIQGWKLWLGVLLACLTWNSHASEPSTVSVLVLSPENNYSAEFRHALAQRLPSRLTLTEEKNTAELVLALGENAFRQAQSLALPVIGVHVSAQSLREAQEQGCHCTVVYREVPPASQLLLLREILPSARRVGVLLGPSSVLTPLSKDKTGLLFEQRVLKRSEDLPAALAEMLPRVDVLLALPDALLYNADTARLILLSSYRQGKPVIGPDEQFVRAGSLAAAYSSAEGLVDATLLLLQHDGLPETLPEPVYARAAVAVNPHVARSYGVIAPNIPDIEKRLEAQQ